MTNSAVVCLPVYVLCISLFFPESVSHDVVTICSGYRLLCAVNCCIEIVQLVVVFVLVFHCCYVSSLIICEVLLHEFCSRVV